MITFSPAAAAALAAVWGVVCGTFWGWVFALESRDELDPGHGALFVFVGLFWPVALVCIALVLAMEQSLKWLSRGAARLHNALSERLGARKG